MKKKTDISRPDPILLTNYTPAQIITTLSGSTPNTTISSVPTAAVQNASLQNNKTSLYYAPDAGE
jgi:hypothetical protein